MLNKLWPAIASTPHATKPSTQNLINIIMEKICQRYNTIAIVEHTNDRSRMAAIDLWRPLSDENELLAYRRLHNERSQMDTHAYHCLMETLTTMIKQQSL
jgi:hypothetical protein